MCVYSGYTVDGEFNKGDYGLFDVVNDFNLRHKPVKPALNQAFNAGLTKNLPR